MIPGKTYDCKVIVFTVEAPPSMSGSGRNAYLFSKQLSDLTSQTTFCHLNYNRKSESGSTDEKLIIRRLAYYNRNLITKIVSFPSLLFYYLKFILKNDLIIIYSGYLIGYQFIILCSFVFRRKIIFRSTLINGDDAKSLLSKGFLLKQLNKLALNKLTFYYSINAEFTERFVAETKDRIPVFESFQGVNIHKFHPVTEDYKRKVRIFLGYKNEEIIILSVGNLVKRKSYHLIFPELAKLNIAFKYIVAGEYILNGNHRITKDEKIEMSELFLLGQSLLGEKIVFTGPVANIQDYFLSADIFLHGSTSEGTPNALLEAMACGIPSLVSKLPGISGLLTQHRVNSIEFENYDELSSLIKNMLANSKMMKGISVNAAKTISEKYTFEIVAANFLKTIYG